MSKKTKNLSVDAPLLHAAHKKPVSRRDFISQGMMAGTASVVGPSILGLLANP